MNDLISVIMPVYNTEMYLGTAIESILNQTYENFEFVIIDDCSTDGSSRVIESYKDSRIKSFRNDKNIGLIKSLNKAITISKGSFIARMDSDDISHHQRFERQLRELNRFNADLCGCHFHVINEFGTKMESTLVPVIEEMIPLYLITTVPFAHGSVMIRRECFEKNNILYGSGFKNIEDHDLWVTLYLKKCKFVNVDEYLFSYRDYSKSFSKRKIKNMRRDSYFLAKTFVEKNIEELIAFKSKIKLDTISHRDKVHYYSALILLSIFTKDYRLFLNFGHIKENYIRKAILNVLKCFIIPRFI